MKKANYMAKLGITIIGYKNYKGINRLLTSLKKLDCKGDDVLLIISVDKSDDDSVLEAANHFQWKNGKKIIITHEQNMGLKDHIISCGDYLEQFSLDAMAVLEDDLYVSPEMYSYMKEAYAFYKDDTRVAGISLYKHELNLNATRPFYDYNDGGDTFFIQYAMSWGQIWLRNQWMLFKQWYIDRRWEKMDTDYLPQNILKWKNSWLKYHIMYCIDKGLYFVYPRQGLVTNFSDVGEHNAHTVTAMQIPLCLKKRAWDFSSFDNTIAIYDAFFENVKLLSIIGLKNLEIDIYGIKKYHPDTHYVLTQRKLPFKVIKKWGLFLRPIEANIINDIQGNDIFLYDVTIPQKRCKQMRYSKEALEYDLKGINIVCLANVQLCITRIYQYLKIKIRKKLN